MAIRPLKSGSNWNLEMLVFDERGKPEYPEKNLSSREEKRTNNKLSPHMASSPGIDPEPHWWEASVLTTAPSCSLNIYISTTEPRAFTTVCILNCSVSVDYL